MKNIKIFLVLFVIPALLLSITACYKREKDSNRGSSITLNPIASNPEEDPAQPVRAAIAPNPSGSNLAPLASATASNFQIGHSPANANDNWFYSYWQSQSGYWGGYIQLTWPTPITLNRLFIYHKTSSDYRDYSSEQKINFIRYFKPGLGWLPLSGVINYSHGDFPYGYIHYVDFAFPPIDTTAVLVSFLPSSRSWTGRVYVNDIEAYGSTTPPEPEITSVEIRYEGSSDNLSANIALSSLKEIKTFQAIGFANSTEIGPVKVNWSLENGSVASGSIRDSILTELNSNIGKIGVFSTSTASTTVLDSETAKFTSFLSGTITLKATAPNGVSKSILIRLMQPTFSIKVWPVGDNSVPLYDQWKSATKEVWEKEKVLQMETMELGEKIDNVVAPNEPLNPFPLLIPTAEAFLNGSFGENVSFLNPIMFDELLNSNYASKGILPRQPFVLFSQKRDQAAINVYPVDVARTYKIFIGFEAQGGYAADSELPYHNFDDQNVIDDKLKSGIAIRNFQTSSPQIRRYFPHEIGHILIRFKDEHKIDGVSVDVPSNNVMTGDPGGVGLEVEAKQFIKILNLDNSKTSPTIFITEK